MRISDWSSDVCSSDLITLRALELGAVDFVFKPGTDLTGRFDAYSAEIIAKVKAAARSKPRIRTTVPTVTPRLSPDAVLPPPDSKRLLPSAGPVIAIGSSAGGSEAVRGLLSAVPPDAPTGGDGRASGRGRRGD